MHIPVSVPPPPAGSIQIERLAPAIEASWDDRTAYQGVTKPGNPAFGQCYPTSRVVQWYFPEFEIACGDVWTGLSLECHFWNVRGSGEDLEKIDLTWSQFPSGSVVRRYEVLDRAKLGDSPATVERCALLLERVILNLVAQNTRGGSR